MEGRGIQMFTGLKQALNKTSGIYCAGETVTIKVLHLFESDSSILNSSIFNSSIFFVAKTAGLPVFKAAVLPNALPNTVIPNTAPKAFPQIFLQVLLLVFLSFIVLSMVRAVAAEPVSSQPAASAVANHSVIGPGAMSAISGVVTVNMTAGDGNVQQNSTALAKSRGLSLANIKASQYAEPGSREFYQQLSAEIGSKALAGVTGVAMINQSSGNSNAQFNGAAIAVGNLGAIAVIQLGDAGLSDYSSGALGHKSDEEQGITDAKVSIAPDAFVGTKGVVMINQVAGNNNVTSNGFTLSIQP